MEIDELALQQGLALGVSQSRAAFGRAPDAIPELTASHLRSALSEWPEQAHSRFQILFAALTGLAATARVVNEEPELTLDDLRAFLGHSALFFNSFKHR